MINGDGCPPGRLQELLDDASRIFVSLTWGGPAKSRYLTRVEVIADHVTFNVTRDSATLSFLLLTELVPSWLAEHFEALLMREEGDTSDS